MKIDILFVVWPFVASAVLVLGVTARMLLSRRRALVGGPPSSGSGARAQRTFWSLLFLAPALGIVMPGAVLAWNGVQWRFYALEGLAIIVGLSTLAACATAAWRAFSD